MNAFLIKRIKQVMEERNISQAKLSRITGIRASSISDYLSGKYHPKQDKIALIADALSVNPGWLMGYDSEESPGPEEDFVPTDNEVIMIQKYRSLPAAGQKTVDVVCDSFGAVPDLAEAVPRYAALDAVDRGKVLERMQQLSEDDKYKPVIKGGRAG